MSGRFSYVGTRACDTSSGSGLHGEGQVLPGSCSPSHREGVLVVDVGRPWNEFTGPGEARLPRAGPPSGVSL